MEFSEQVVMNIHEASSYLGVSKGTLYEMARNGRIPAVKIGGQWRFYRKAVNRWLTEKSYQNVSGAIYVDAKAEEILQGIEV